MHIIFLQKFMFYYIIDKNGSVILTKRIRTLQYYSVIFGSWFIYMHLLAFGVLLALSRQEQQKKMHVYIPMYNSE